MKKFLTVLLALSVVFTYTVGTAFAITTDDAGYADYKDTQYELSEVETAIYAQAQTNIGMLDNVKSNFLSNYAANAVSINGIAISKAAVQEVIDDVFKDITTAINTEASEQKIAAVEASQATNFAFFTKAEKEAYETAVNTEYLKYDTADEIKEYIQNNAAANGYDKKLLAAEYAIQKSEVLGLLGKVDSTKYSDTVPSTANNQSNYYIDASDSDVYAAVGNKAGYYSFKAQVEALLNAAKAALNENDVDSTDTADVMENSINAIKEEADWVKANYTDKVPSYIKTLQEEGWDTEDITRAQEKMISALKTHLSNEKAKEYDSLSEDIRALERKEAAGTTLTAAERKTLAEKKEALAALDGDYANLETVYVEKVKNDDAYDTVGEIKAFLEVGDWTAFPTTVADKTLAAKKAAKVADLKQEAETLKSMYGFNGEKVYDAADVDAGLADATTAAYLATDENALKEIEVADYVTENYDFVKAEMEKVLGTKTDIEIDKKIYSGVGAWEAAATTDNYDDKYLEEVQKVIADAKDAIRAAKTVADVDAAFVAASAKFDAVLTKADRDAAQTEKAYTDAVADYTKKLTAALQSKATIYGDDFDTDYNTANLLANLIGTTANDKGLCSAYSVEEMAKLYDEALNTINTLKSNDELTKEAKAINDAITAVKVPVTAADRDALLALQERVDDFEEYIKTLDDSATLASYNIRDTYLASLIDDVAAIDAKSIKDAAAEIMKDGKITLNEEEAVKALNEQVDAYAENYGADAKAELLTDVNTAAAYDYNFTALKVAAVEEAIAKIDPSADPLDAAAIKAARAAYEALGETTINPVYYSKLLSLENLLEAQEIKAVEALKITASSTQGKNYIKVKWTVKGDDSAIDGYQVYRSVKKNSGFGTKPFFKTTKKSYKNTKSLKKGTRYYYKVRAYKVVDGKTYYSDWSNKAYRTYKYKTLK